MTPTERAITYRGWGCLDRGPDYSGWQHPAHGIVYRAGPRWARWRWVPHGAAMPVAKTWPTLADAAREAEAWRW